MLRAGPLYLLFFPFFFLALCYQRNFCCICSMALMVSITKDACMTKMEVTFCFSMALGGRLETCSDGFHRLGR
jgi:hypothetical protein